MNGFEKKVNEIISFKENQLLAQLFPEEGSLKRAKIALRRAREKPHSKLRQAEYLKNYPIQSTWPLVAGNIQNTEDLTQIEAATQLHFLEIQKHIPIVKILIDNFYKDSAELTYDQIAKLAVVDINTNDDLRFNVMQALDTEFKKRVLAKFESKNIVLDEKEKSRLDSYHGITSWSSRYSGIKFGGDHIPHIASASKGVDKLVSYDLIAEEVIKELERENLKIAYTKG